MEGGEIRRKSTEIVLENQNPAYDLSKMVRVKVQKKRCAAAALKISIENNNHLGDWVRLCNSDKEKKNNHLGGLCQAL
ncbi:hypothetical protein Bca101_081502 [Brassica carinata]